MMHRRLGLLLLAVFVFLLRPAWSATYYVATTGSDSNPCTQAQPCRTWSKGRTMLASGDTLYFRQGTYNEGIIVTKATPVPSGSAWTAMTTIAGYPGETVTLTGNISFPSQGPDTPALEQLFQYITFKNFLVRTSGNGGIGGLGCGFIFGTNTPRMECGPHYIRWELLDVADPGCASGAGGGFGSTDFHFVNVHVHHGGCDHLDHAWYISAERTLLDGCEADHFTGYGIQIYDSGCGRPAGVAGYNCGESTVIRNSSFHHNGQSGVYGGVSLGHGRNIQFYNNLVYANVVGGLEVSFNTPYNTQIYNNVIYGNGGDGLHIDAAATNTVVRNNILMNNAHGVYNTGSTTIKDHNLCATFDPFCDLAPANPLFTNPGAGDFTLSSPSSPAHDTGVPVSTPTVGPILSTVGFDKQGAFRGQGAGWDIGAYEFNEGVPPCPPSCPVVCPPDCPPSGNPIYVAQTGGNDSRTCFTAETEGTPFLTITQGLTCMGTVPGKTMYIKAGTYTDCLDTGSQPLKGGNGPSYADATVIASYGTDLVTIHPTSCPHGAVAFFGNGAADSYIVVRGSSTNRLVFDGTAIPNNVVLYPGAHHVRFEFVEVKNTANFETFYGLNTANIEVVDSLAHGAVTSGIAFDGTVTNWLIERTTVSSNGGIGLNHKAGTIAGLTIKESTVRDNTGTGHGISLGAGTGVTILNTLVYDNGGVGIRLFTGGTGTKLYHNTVYSNTGNGVQCDAGASGVELTNNIVFGNAAEIVNSCSATLLTNLTTDPLFVSAPTDLHLGVGSAAMDHGTPLPSVTIDRDGAARVGPADIGAYTATTTPPPAGDDTVRLRNLRAAGMLF